MLNYGGVGGGTYGGAGAVIAGTAALTGGAIQGVQGLPCGIAQWAVPFIYCSSGTIGNNGALSAITALPNGFANGAWVWYPALAIAASGAGSAAGWYWTVFSTNAAGTIYNSTYTSGTPTLGVTTPFVTTGPGAFTSTLAEVIGPIINVAANSMGPNGRVIFDAVANHTSNANAKSYRAKFGGTQVWFASATTSPATVIGEVKNRGVTGAQVARMVAAYTGDSTGIAYPAIDTTSTVQLSYTLQKAVATDNGILEGGSVAVAYGA